MKIVAAIVMGFFSGCLIYLMGNFLSLAGVGFQGANQAFPLRVILLLGGWAVSAYLLLRGAQTASKVLARGFLLGAAEWLLMIGVGFIHAARSVDVSGAPGSHPEASIVGGGIVAAVMGGASLFMALVCLAGFAVVHFWKREMKPEKAEVAESQPLPSIEPRL